MFVTRNGSGSHSGIVLRLRFDLKSTRSPSLITHLLVFNLASYSRFICALAFPQTRWNDLSAAAQKNTVRLSSWYYWWHAWRMLANRSFSHLRRTWPGWSFGRPPSLLCEFVRASEPLGKRSQPAGWCSARPAPGCLVKPPRVSRSDVVRSSRRCWSHLVCGWSWNRIVWDAGPTARF